ncbi:hypothetical protein BH10PSE19_BH10PSE19_21240 [soil metagenome]
MTRRKLNTKLCLILLLTMLLNGCFVISPTTFNVIEYVDDSVLVANVQAKIAEELGVWSYSAINVTSYLGVVQLSGFLDTPNQIYRAFLAAHKVPGVRRLANCLHIKTQVGAPAPRFYDYPIAWGYHYR